MDYSTTVGYANKANQITQANYSRPAQIFVPIVSEALDAARQTYLLEEFREYVISSYTNEDSFQNCLLNILFSNNEIYSTAATNYIKYGAGMAKMHPQDFENNKAARLQLARKCHYMVPEVEGQMKFWAQHHSNNQLAMQFIQAARQELNVDWLNKIRTNMDATLANKASGMGGGMPGSQSGGMPGASSGGMPGAATGGMPGSMNNMSSAPTQSGSQNHLGIPQQNTNVMPNTGLPQSQPQQPTPQTQPTPVARAVAEPRRESYKLFCDPKHPQYKQLIQAQREVVGGWAVNLEPSMFESEHTFFNEFRWVTKYGTLTNSIEPVVTTYSDYDRLMDMFESNRSRAVEKCLAQFPEFDAKDPESEGYKHYLAILADFDKAEAEKLLAIEAGLYKGQNDFLTTRTSAWGIMPSMNESIERMFDPTTLNMLGDALQVTIIHGREYYLIDSKDSFANGLVLSRRNQFGTPFVKQDNTSREGHYYIINHYLLDFDGAPVIEDFYDMEIYMDASRYAVETKTAAFQMDSDEPGEMVDVNVEPKLNLLDCEFTTLGNTPVALANHMVTDATNKRIGNWENSVLTAKTVEPLYVMTVSDKDKAFMKELQLKLNKGELATLTALGEWLEESESNKFMSARMKHLIDGRMTKEMNIVMNDMLGFDNLTIERSFIEEYAELLDIVSSPNSSPRAELLLRNAETFIIRRALLTVDMSKPASAKYVDYYALTSPYEIIEKNKTKKIVIAKDHEVELKDVLHVWAETTRVYVLPLTTLELGVNPHQGTISAPWNILPEMLVEELRKSFGGPLNMERVKLVTKDNYVLNVTATNNADVAGTITIDL